MRGRFVVAAVLAILLLGSSFAHALRLCAISRHDVRLATGHCPAHAPGDHAGRSSGSEPWKVPRCCDPSIAIAAIPSARATVAVASGAPLSTSAALDVAQLDRPRVLATARSLLVTVRRAPQRFGGVRDHLAQAILLI